MLLVHDRPSASTPDLPSDLRVQSSDGHWLSVPAWAQGLLGLGHQTGKADMGEHRRVLALCLPYRDLAALFITAGIVSARLSRDLTLKEREKQLEELCQLPVGTGVVIWQGEKRQRAKKQEECTGEGTKRQVRFQTNKKDAATVIGFQNIELVEPIEDEVNVSGSQLSTRVNPFLFAGHNLHQFRPHAWTDCLLISNSVQLETEANLKLRKVSSGIDGKLADLCAIDSLVNNGEIPRTVLLPSMSEEGSYSRTRLRSNSIVIFDGASAFMRHQHTLPAQDHVVLLTPDEASYRDAISYLNTACARRLDDFEWSLEVIPEGVEAMMWLERRNAD